LIPAGRLETVPPPAPDFVTVSVNCGAREKVAVADTALVGIGKLQGPVPEQGPVQPANTYKDDPSIAVNVTAVPLLMLLLHVPEVAPAVAVQLMPPVPLTEPLPVPAATTVSENAAGIKFALTDFAALIVTAQAPVPVQAPLQPAKTEAAEDGVAVSVTAVFWM
jgi:hypothetical protein